MHLLGLFTAFALAVALEVARAQGDGLWTASSGGSWANAGNWLDGGIAGGADNTATFGLSLFPINASATFTLDGARTIGNITLTAQTTPANWSLKTGTGGPLTLATTFDLPALSVSPAGLEFTLNTIVAGTNGLEKQGAGVLVLAATNSYTGGTLVSGGILLVNGKLADTSAVTVASGTLGGTGLISGPLTVQAGGIFSPGNPLGTLTISNTVTLQAGSKTEVNVNAATLSHDSVSGISDVNFGGTLTVSNLAGTPALGQSFQVFNASNASGNFSGITPQLTGALRWRFNAASGVLSVVSTNLQPEISSISFQAGTNLFLSIINGVPGATNYVLTSTNLALPKASWSLLATNVFDAGGNVLSTNVLAPNLPQQFFIISFSASP